MNGASSAIINELVMMAPVRMPSHAKSINFLPPCFINFVAIKRDITQELNLENQLHHAQKMESIGLLAGGVAHDFNNILTTIMGYSSLLKKSPDMPEKHRKRIEEVEKASMRGAEITGQLLAFSRKQPPRLEKIILNDVINSSLKFLKRALPPDITVESRLSENLALVNADSTQIQQILMNLCLNSRDAMPHGGKILIETENIEIEQGYIKNHYFAKTGPHVLLTFRDTGAGMNKEVLSRIFEPFFTTKPVGKGTGLGLSTVYGIVKQSEGEVWCYSEPGQGTTFKIYLPRVEEEMSLLPHRDDKDSLPGGRETIFLVEDEPSVRGLAVQVLRESGYNLLQAANGTEALRVAQEYAGKIHLLLTDVVMPQMGGKELADRLKPLRPDIKVLFTSGYTDNAIVHHGVLGPGIEFLQKPFSPEALAQKVREVLDK